jgi:hypothetical protein
MRVKEATTNDRSLTSASQRRGRFIRLFAHVGDVIMALVIATPVLSTSARVAIASIASRFMVFPP